MAGLLEEAEHTEYGTLALATPDGDRQIVPGCSMTFQTVRPGERTTPQEHAWRHLYFVRSGTGTAHLGEDGPTTLAAGDILHIPAWTVHRFENAAAADDLLLLNMSNLPQQAALGNHRSRENARPQ